MEVSRRYLDRDRIIAAVLRQESYSSIADAETARLHGLGHRNVKVTKNQIVAFVRDVKGEKLKVSGGDNQFIKTYVYGVEEDNGGIPVFTGELEISGNFLILNDVHLPFTNYELLERAIDVARFYGITQVILAGDWLDENGASVFRNLVKPVALRTELEVSRKVIGELLQGMENIFYIRGNHDDRVTLGSDSDFDFESLGELIADPEHRSKLAISPYDRIFLTSGNERWGIFHQKNTSVSKNKVAEELALKFLCNVVATHQHTMGYGHDRYNHFVAITSAGLHDDRMMAYGRLKTTTGPVPENSFVTIVDGRGELWTPDPRLTDWSRIYAG